MDDTYSVKLQVDSSDLNMAAQQAQMVAMNSAISAGQIGLNPVANMIQNSMIQQMQGGSSFNTLLSNPISMGTGNPFQHMGMGNITTPQGYIAGTPMGPEPSSRSMRNIGAGVIDLGIRKFVNSSMGNFVQNYFPSAGFLGLSGGGDLNTPVYRANQMFVEKFAESVDTVKANAWQVAGVGAVAAGTWAGIKYGGGLAGMIGAPAAIGAFALGQTLDYGFNVREKYMDIGRYYRDATASVYRDKLGGGASAEKAAEVMRGFSKTVAKDDYLMRDDYQLLLQAGTELNAFASNRSPDDTIRALKNIASTVKTLSAVGVHLKDMQQDLGILVQMGLDPSKNNFQNARFLGGMGMNAFSANMTTQQMLMASAQGSPIYAGMGIAPQIGAAVHSQSLATSGEAIRSGVFGIADQAYYGGQQGIAAANTRAAATLAGSPLGMAFTLAAIRSQGMEQGMVKGTQGINDLLGGNTLNMDPTTYSNLLYKLPQLTKDMDPTMFGMGQVGALVKSLSQTLGRKLSAGEIQQILVNRGVSPDDARVTMNQLEHANEIGGAQFESLVNKQKQLQFEVMRPPANIFTNPKLFAQKLTERWSERPISAWTAGNMESIGHWEEWMEGNLFDKIIHPEKEHVYKIGSSERGVEGVKMWGDYYKQKDVEQSRRSKEVDDAKKAAIIKNYRDYEAGLTADERFLENPSMNNLMLKSISTGAWEYSIEDQGVNTVVATKAANMAKNLKQKSQISVEDEAQIKRIAEANGGRIPKEVRAAILQKNASLIKQSVLSDSDIIQHVNANKDIWEGMQSGITSGADDIGVGGAVEDGLINLTRTQKAQQARDIIQGYDKGEKAGQLVVAKQTYGARISNEELDSLARNDPTFLRRMGVRLPMLRDFLGEDEPDLKKKIDSRIKMIKNQAAVVEGSSGSKQVEKDYKLIENAFTTFGATVINRPTSFYAWFKNDQGVSKNDLTENRLEGMRLKTLDAVLLSNDATQMRVSDLRELLPADSPSLKHLVGLRADGFVEPKTLDKVKRENDTNIAAFPFSSMDTKEKDFFAQFDKSLASNPALSPFSKMFLRDTKNAKAIIGKKFSFTMDNQITNLVNLNGVLGGDPAVKEILTQIRKRGSMSNEDAEALMKTVSTLKGSDNISQAMRGVGEAYEVLQDSNGDSSKMAKAKEGFIAALAFTGLSDPKVAGAEADNIIEQYKDKGQGKASAAMAALGSVIQQTAGSEVVTGNKGKYLNSEQQAGLRQASRDVSNIIQLTSSISSSIEKVPESLEKFRKDFMDEFRTVALNIANNTGGKKPSSGEQASKMAGRTEAEKTSSTYYNGGTPFKP